MGIRIDSEWKKSLRPAEFRGVPFFIDSHEFEGGRNPVPHMVPDSDNVFSEDMGRKADGFSIRGHILGDNYFQIRDALESALKKEGPGILKHPYLGIKDVQVDGFRLREDTQQGRYATFVIRFLEAGEPFFPIAIFNAIAEVFNDANEAIDTVQTAFELAYSLTDVPSFVVSQLNTTIKTLAADMTDAIDKVTTLPDKKAEFLKLVDGLNKAGDEGGVDTTDATEVGDTTFGLIEAMGVVAIDVEFDETSTIDLSGGKNDKLSVYDPLLTFGDDILPTLNDDTPSNTSTKNATIALIDLVQQAIAISLAKLATAIQTVSINEGLVLQQKVTDLLNDILLTVEDDQLFQDLKDTSASFVQAVPSQDLATVIQINNKINLPSLFVAYEAYGSIDLEQDIIDRNAIRNPASLPAGELSILSG